MFSFKIVVTLLLGKGLSSHTKFSGGPGISLNWESCNYGDDIQNSCNTCTCTSKGVYECESRNCNSTLDDLTSTKVCQPNKVYFRQGTYCICRGEGRWPHQFCHDLFRGLPEQSVEKKICDPEGYVRVDCNICRCSARGDVDTTRCTVNKCEEETSFRKNNARNAANMFGSCKIKNWYSMAPCQLCFCLDTNRLICSTGISKPTNVPLGQNFLTSCGPDFLKQAASLMLRDRIKTISHFIYGSNPFQMVNDPSLNLIGLNLNQNSFGKMKPQDLAINFEANMDTMSSTRMPQLAHKHDPFAVLKKMMGTRRTLTINPKANCVPGTVTSVKCNICHCLTNGKLICSNNKCGYK